MLYYAMPTWKSTGSSVTSRVVLLGAGALPKVHTRCRGAPWMSIIPRSIQGTGAPGLGAAEMANREARIVVTELVLRRTYDP